MKKTKLWVAMEILKFIFWGGVPIALFLWKCTTILGKTGGTKFMVGCSSYIVALILFVIIKKVLFKNYFTSLQQKIVNYTTQLETETDKTKISLIEKALGKTLVVRDLIQCVPIFLVLGLVLVLCKALETELVTLFSVLGMSACSFALGLIAMLIQDGNTVSKNR